MKEKSPVGRIWEMGEKEHGKLITAVILAVLGVACGMAPHFAAAKIIVLLLAGEKVFWLICRGFLRRLAVFFCARCCITARWGYPTGQPSAFLRQFVKSCLQSCRACRWER